MAAELLDLGSSAEASVAWIDESVSDLVTRLFKISMLADESPKGDAYARAEASSSAKFDDKFDVMHVKEYVKARGGSGTSEQWLLNRLGHAITRRREFVRYRRENSERIAAAPYMPYPTDSKHLDRKVRRYLPEGPALFPLATPSSTSGPVGLHRSAADTIPSVITPESAYVKTDALTIATSGSFSQAPGDMGIPNLSEYARPDMPFECPYCGEMQQFGGNRAWR